MGMGLYKYVWGKNLTKVLCASEATQRWRIFESFTFLWKGENVESCTKFGGMLKSEVRTVNENLVIL